MSVAYQSWEVASGPTVGYNIGAQGNSCGPEGSNYMLHPQQDTVIRGLSALSLCVQSHSEADGSAEETGCHREYASLSKDGASLVFAPPPLARATSTDHQLVAMKDDEACLLSDSTRLRNGRTSVVNTQLSDGNHRFGRFSDVFWNTSTLDVVSEDRPWENVENVMESDTISSSSSICDAPGDSPCSSEDVSQAAIEDVAEQSSFQEVSDGMSCLETPLLPKKGLSRFYSGKSRSFSCLADVISVRDLAKPENPYSRKRKNLMSYSSSFDRPRLQRQRSGAAGIMKKPPLHNCKCTLALAIAMNTEVSLDTQVQDLKVSLGVSGGWPSNSAPSRSYSLSDLQKAGNPFVPR